MVENNDEYHRLYWACRRGMLELDRLLIPYLEDSYNTMSAHDKGLLRGFLSHTDPELYGWLMGLLEPDNPQFVELISIIRRRSNTMT